MPRISEIDPAHAPEAIQKIIADHVSDGHALTAEKRTLLHNAAAFNAVEDGSYVLDDELQRLIGKRAADFYEYAISQYSLKAKEVLSGHLSATELPF